jgi:hypothetical protein
MRLAQANELIKACAEQMNARYKEVVFDEWAILSLGQTKGKLLSYTGPRKQGFQKHFLKDMDVLRDGLIHVDYAVGDFEFVRDGVGPAYEAFMVVGRGLYLICNNTVKSMDGITQSSVWLGAQVAFVELSERFRANPLEWVN